LKQYTSAILLVGNRTGALELLGTLELLVTLELVVAMGCMVLLLKLVSFQL